MVLDETLYVKSDGSYAKVRRRMTPDGRAYTVRMVADTRRRVTFSTDDLTRSVTTAPFEDAQRSQKPVSCVADSPEQVSQILDFRVLKSTSKTTSQPDGESFYHERWIAPDLNCLALKAIHYRSKGAGKFAVATLTEVTSITLGEPEPSLFEQPAPEYAEKPPSQVLTEMQALKGTPIPTACETCQRSLNALDDVYNSRRSRGAK